MQLDTKTVVAIVVAAAQLVKELAPLVQQGQDVFSSEDETKIKSALADIQEANDTLFPDVQKELRGE